MSQFEPPDSAAGTMTPPGGTAIDPLIGRTLEGKYRLDGKLGAGGMGAVYRATRLMIGDIVAVKILHPQQVADPQASERFRREAQAAARLKHQNAVTIYDFGVSNEGLVYLVMELAEGQSLRDIIKEQGPVTPTAAAEIMSQVCAALDEAHRQHIVHRDMKPDNIIVASAHGGLRVKVLDFGIAKMRDLTASNLTQTGSVMGTPYYMSPEQCMGEELDSRSDIYSLGIVLYEMLAGVVPFNSPTSTAVVIQHVNQAPPSLRALNASISPGVEAVVMHALEKRREARPQTAVQLAQELTASVQGRLLTLNSGSMPVSAYYPTPASATPSATPVTSAGLAATIHMTTPPAISGARTAAPARNRLPLLLGGAAVIMIAAIGLAIVMWSQWARISSTGPGGIPLTSFDFTVVKLNSSGREIDRSSKQAREYVEDLGGGVRLDMVEIPSGSFLMGSPASEGERSPDEGPQHRVNVPSFYIGRFELTQAQWRAVMGTKPSHFKGENLPVEQVSWEDAAEFCRQLSRKTGRTYRLPSEAEWEYACRAGTTTPFHFGETIYPDFVNYGVDYLYGSAPKGEFRKRTTPVGSLGAANDFGLYDMHGNVGEWCQDWYHDSYAGAPGDGSAWESGGEQNSRVLRGGSWNGSAIGCRAAFRYWDTPAYHYNLIGFRVVVAARTL